MSRARNPYRHCRCGDALLDSILRALPLPANHPARIQLMASRGMVAAGCPGTEIAPIHWRGVEQTIPKVLEREIRKALDGYEEIPAQEWADQLLAGPTLDHCAEVIVGSLTRIMDMFYRDAPARTKRASAAH